MISAYAFHMSVLACAKSVHVFQKLSYPPDPLLIKEHFTNLLNYRQLKANFRLSNL